MRNVICKKSTLLSLLIAFSLMFVTTTDGIALSVENENESACEEQAQIIENVTSSNLINDDVYEIKDAVVADGYSSEITIPKDGDAAINVNDGEGSTLEFSLPDETRGADGLLTDNGTVVYNCDEDVSVAVQPLTEQVGDEQIDSVRALITIPNESAPHEYSFEFNLQNGERLVTAKEYLGSEYDTGEVYIVDSNNRIVSVVDSAWAKDANGNAINTYYDVRGNSLVQVVDFDENTAFPVVADPSVWQITKCLGAIVEVVAGVAVPVAKIAKVKKYIKALDGVKKATSKFGKAIKFAKAEAKRHKSKKWWKYLKTMNVKKHVGHTVVSLALIISGIDGVITKCGPIFK